MAHLTSSQVVTNKQERIRQSLGGRQWSAGKLVPILDTIHWNLKHHHKRYHAFTYGGKAPPYCASSQLQRVSLVILIKPLT